MSSVLNVNQVKLSKSQVVCFSILATGGVMPRHVEASVEGNYITSAVGTCRYLEVSKRSKGAVMEDTSISKDIRTIKVLPWGLEVECPTGETLMKTLNRAGIYFKNSCERSGSCGRCKVKVSSVDGEDHKELLACKIRLDKDALVEVPPKNVMED